jgi:hypothetical protein
MTPLVSTRNTRGTPSKTIISPGHVWLAEPKLVELDPADARRFDEPSELALANRVHLKRQTRFRILIVA